MNTHQLYINGEFVDSSSDATVDVIDPSTTEIIGRVPDAGAADVDRAVKAARAAFDAGPWRTMTPSQRGRLIWKVADLIEEHLDEFAQLETLDNGKPLTVARAARGSSRCRARG